MAQTRSPGLQVGRYTIDQWQNEGGIVSVVAHARAQTIEAADILSVLRLLYDQLQRKTA